MKRPDPIAQLGFTVFVIVVIGLCGIGRNHYDPSEIVPTRFQIQPGTLGELAATGQLSIQYANLEALDALPGIGPKTAERIIRWREQRILSK